MRKQTKPEKILVLDDHELILQGTLKALVKQYPQTKISTALTAEMALGKIERFKPDLLLADLAIPIHEGLIARVNDGIELLKSLMRKKPYLNIVVLSSNAKALVRIKKEIEEHQGGFTIADKTSIADLIDKINWSMMGISYTKNINLLDREELKLEWYRLLELGSRGFTDKEIAKELNIAERTVWSYWHKIRDAFQLYPAPGERQERKKIKTLTKARELGYID